MRKESNIIIRGKVFVHDDEQGIVDAIKTVLEKEGFEVHGTTNTVEATQKIRDSNYDILILDYLLDGYNAEYVIDTVRQFSSSIYIILLTGHVDLAPPKETIRKLKIQNYCEKEGSFDKLIIQVETALKVKEYYLDVLFNEVSTKDMMPKLRELHGETQEELATAIGVNRGTIIDIENGNSNPSYITLRKIADHWNTTVDFLTGRFIMNNKKTRGE